jgi:hypothetical protein
MHRGPLASEQTQLPHIVEVIGINTELVTPRLGDDFVQILVGGRVKLLSLQAGLSAEQGVNQDSFITSVVRCV